MSISAYNSQESLGSSSFHAQGSSFHASPSQSYDRLDAFGSNASPAQATGGFRDESKSPGEKAKASTGTVSYSKQSSRSENKTPAEQDSGGVGMRTQILDSMRGAGAKEGLPCPDGSGSYEADYGHFYGTSPRGEAEDGDDGVLLGTAGYSPRSGLGSTGNTAFASTSGGVSLGGSGGAGGDAYNSVDRLKGLLGSSADRGTGGDPWAREDSSVPAASKVEAAVCARTSSTGAMWLGGRAPLPDIEDGSALDVLVSAVRLNQQLISSSSTKELQLQFSFLGQLSQKSESLDLAGRTAEQTLLPTQYAARLGPAAEGAVLRDEISAEEEAISVTAYLRDPHTGENVGAANINLWMMIEDSVNIFRHEIDVYSLASGNGLREGLVLGSVFVDVRGYRMLLNHYSV
jgi:hypothetical protein